MLTGKDFAKFSLFLRRRCSPELRSEQLEYSAFTIGFAWGMQAAVVCKTIPELVGMVNGGLTAANLRCRVSEQLALEFLRDKAD